MSKKTAKVAEFKGAVGTMLQVRRAYATVFGRTMESTGISFGDAVAAILANLGTLPGVAFIATTSNDPWARVDVGNRVRFSVRGIDREGIAVGGICRGPAEGWDVVTILEMTGRRTDVAIGGPDAQVAGFPGWNGPVGTVIA